MPAVDAGCPLSGGMLPQRGAVVLEIQRQLHLQWVLKLGRLQDYPQQRSSREVCDCKSLADEIRAALPLVLNAIKSRGNDCPIPFQIAFANLMPEPVECWKNPEARPERTVGLAARARRQHAQRNVWIVPEQRRRDSRTQRRAKCLVEIVLQ